jgi:hypothetical protein
VTFDAALFCPTIALPKEIVVGVAVTAATPDPARLTVCGLLLPLSVTVKVPFRAPSAEGVNVTETVQVLPAARVEGLLGQVVVWL